METFPFKIESVENQSEIIQFLDDKIYEYNSSAINKTDGELFTKIIRDKNENIIGGITGWTWSGVSEITLFWVKDEYRNKGLGKMLLNAAEKDIIESGCTMILLRTYSFQSPLFYEKNGYLPIFVLDNFPAGYKHYTLLKKIK